MDDLHYFADVDLPFHVWVREGRRWVLRDTRPQREPRAQPCGGVVERGRCRPEQSKPDG